MGVFTRTLLDLTYAVTLCVRQPAASSPEMSCQNALCHVGDHGLERSGRVYQLDVVVDVAEHVAEGADDDHLAEPAVDADALVCAGMTERSCVRAAS
jgi:hypothetical protein